MKKGKVILLASMLALVATPVFAGNRAGAFTITPEIGYYGFAGKRHLDNVATVPAFALGYNFYKNWGIEFAYANLNTRFSSSSNYTGGVTGNLYTLDGVYHFNAMGPGQMFEPFIDLGLGATHLNPNGNRPANLMNINGALGAQMFFSESVALRAEVRDLYTMSGGANDWMTDIGVSFLVGGNTPAPANYKDSGDM